MKRLQVIQSNLEPDKNVLWLDKYKKLKLYNGDGWEDIPQNLEVLSKNVSYKDKNLESVIDDLYDKLDNIEEDTEISDEYDFNSLGFTMIENSQVLADTEGNKIPDGEYAKYIGEIDSEGNIIDYNIAWTNIDGDFPKSVHLQIGKIYLIRYINIDNFNNLVLIPLEIQQVDWNETDVNSKNFIKNKPIIPTIDSDYTVKSSSVIVEAEKKNAYIDPFSVYKYNIYSNINNTKYSLLNLDSLQGNKTNINNTTFTWNKEEKGKQYINLLYSSSSIGQIVYKIQIEDTSNNNIHEHYCYLLFDTPSNATFICCTTLSWQISFKTITPTSGNSTNIHAFLQIPYNFIGNISITPMFYIKYHTSSDNFGIMDKSSDGTLTTYKFPGITDRDTINMNFFKNSKIYDTDVEIESSNITYPNGKYEIDFVDYFGELQLGDTITDDKIKSLIKEGYYV